MSGNLSVTHWEIEIPDALRCNVEDERMVKCIRYPGEEGVHLEECVLLSELVKLWVSIKEAGGDELIKDTHGERWEHSEEDVVERESPGFVDDFSREEILEHILNQLAEFKVSDENHLPRTVSCIR